MKKISPKRVPVSCSDNRQSKIQNLKWGGLIALVVAFALCGVMADAQQAGKVARIGYLLAQLLAMPSSWTGFGKS